MKRKIFDIIQIGDKSNLISRAFDFFIVATIFLNIGAMLLDTFDNLSVYEGVFHVIEIVTTLIFLLEYILRIWTAEFLYPTRTVTNARLRFLISFDGVVDLLTIIPAYFLTGFIVFRMLRVVRIFHLFRINAQYDSFNVITSVFKDKKNQLVSSVFIILILMLASSLCMYSAEHEAQPENFKNAFSGIWWSVSTILTVGYGDIYPVTVLGKVMAIIIAFLGVGVVAIPTGIISAGFVEYYTKIRNSPRDKGKKLVYISHPVSGEGRSRNIKDIERIISALYEKEEISSRYCIISPVHTFAYDEVLTKQERRMDFCIDLLEHSDMMLVFGDSETNSIVNSPQCRTEIEYCKEHVKEYHVCPTVDDAIYTLITDK